MKTRRILAPLLLMIAAVSARAAPPAPGADRLVLIVNTRVAEGEALALEYASRRGVPTGRICRLDLPVTESMSRGDYETRLRDPLLAFLRDAGLVQQVRRADEAAGSHGSGWETVSAAVDYLAPVLGVPVRIDDTKPWPLDKLQGVIQQGGMKDEAAVDSELALLLHDRYEIRSRVANPLYNHLSVAAAGATPPILRVARLDGPDPATVRRMLASAWAAEETGWLGRVYIDRRAAHDDSYSTGDWWLEQSALALERAGFFVEVNRSDSVFGELYPMEAPVVYLGWYTEQVIGPFASTGFAFRAGALAYHIHSASAKALRTGTEYWCGPLLARGAAATFGSVSEPFLTMTPDPSILLDRLLRGQAFADAVCLATPVLSWQTTVVGDPLYRPFARSLDEQIRRLEADANPDVAWAQLRKINLLALEGRLHVALSYAREVVKRSDHYVLRDRMAELYAMNAMPDEAVVHYEKALELAPDAVAAVRVAGRYGALLRLLKRDADAARVDAAVRERWAGSPYLQVLGNSAP